MNYVSRIAAAALLLAGLSQSAAFAAGPPGAPPPGAPQPKILVVDRNAVLSRSAAGASIMKQVNVLATSAENGIKAKGDALRKEYAQLQQQVAILAPAAKNAKLNAFKAKETALNADIQKQQMMIQGGLNAARETVLKTLGPVLQKIVIERGANLLLDRSMVVVSSNAFDITEVAIARLNQALPSVTIKPQMPPQQPGGGPPQR